ncbi:MAG: hypothetical protein ABR579_09380 [Actinomycetota bacterium]
MIASRNPALARADAGGGEQGLRVIGTYPHQWRVMIGSQVVAIAMTVAGLSLIASSLRSTNAGIEAALTTGAYAIGATLMFVYLGFHLTATVRARSAESYEPRRRRYARLYRAYMVIAYLAFAHVGASFLLHEVVGPGLGWFLVTMGAAGAVTMIVRRPKIRGLLVSDLPLWIHVIAGVFGAGIVLRS